MGVNGLECGCECEREKNNQCFSLSLFLTNHSVINLGRSVNKSIVSETFYAGDILGKTHYLVAVSIFIVIPDI